MQSMAKRFGCDELKRVGDWLSSMQKIRKNNLWALLYKEQQICGFEWDDIHYFGSYDVVKVERDGKCGLLRTDGSMPLACVYNNISVLDRNAHSPFLLTVEKEGKTGIITIDGMEILSPCYDNIIPTGFYDWDHHDNEAFWCPLPSFVIKDKLIGIMCHVDELSAAENKLIFQPQWKECEYMKTGYTHISDCCDVDWTQFAYFVRVRKSKKGKWGVVDTSGREITPCKWDRIDRYGNACLDKLWGFVNLITGEEIAPQWMENQHLCPYDLAQAAGVDDNAFRGNKSIWTTTMRIFRQKS